MTNKKSTPIDVSKISFSIIKKRGSPTKALTLDGIKVEKMDWVASDDPFDNNSPPRKIKLRCMDYHDEHFVYIDPTNKMGRWWAWCTCGSPAVIIDPKAYQEISSPSLACYFHAQFGRHVTGDGRKWK